MSYSPQWSRTSPIQAVLQKTLQSPATSQGLKPDRWQLQQAMLTLTERDSDRHLSAVLGIADLSYQRRLGLKGAGAADWLIQQNLPVPERPNGWQPIATLAQKRPGLIARLGRSEFLLDGLDPSLYDALSHTLSGALPAQLYPVLRQDLALGLCGERLPELFAQVCSIEFSGLNLADRPVVLTSMAGVAVTVLPLASPCLYQIWCDGTYGPYLWQTLIGIAAELGGGAIGSAIVASMLDSALDAAIDTSALNPNP